MHLYRDGLDPLRLLADGQIVPRAYHRQAVKHYRRHRSDSADAASGRQPVPDADD